MIKVAVFKWDNGVHPKKGIKFVGEHVNRFFSMLDRNTSVPYEKICITDNPEGISPEVTIIPLWDDLREMGGCYTRLKLFDPTMSDLIGEKLIWFDLDTVICGNMDSILNDPSDFKMYGDTHPRTYYNGSMCLITPNFRPDVWLSFDPKRTPLETRRRGFIGTDQAWLSLCLGPHYPKWSMADGVYSFRCHFEKLGRTALPQNAKMVMFHGRHDPSMVDVHKKYPWVEEHWY